MSNQQRAINHQFLSFARMKRLLVLLALLSAPPVAAPVAASSFYLSTTMSLYDTPTLRRHYELAAADKQAGEKFYSLLHDYAGQEALVLGYKAASEAIRARDASMLSKLSYVQQAARTFEQAVALAPNNAEIRFLRFSVESNLPPFLGLSKHVDEDRAFLLEAALQYPRSGLDTQAFETVRGFLVDRKHVSGDEAQLLARIKS